MKVKDVTAISRTTRKIRHSLYITDLKGFTLKKRENRTQKKDTKNEG
jgi:hypothetical protein